MQEIKEIPIGEIKVGEHDQRIKIDDESLEGLVSSIGRIGMVYPCIVRRQGDEFLLLEGHRRLAACKRLGKKAVPCSVTEGEKDTAAEIAFAGNFFRKDLSPVELASALKDAAESRGLSMSELAAGFHRSEHWVVSMIAICDWPEDVQQAMHNNGLSISAASNLACVTDREYREFLLQNAIDGGVTARTTAAWLQAWRNMQPAAEAVQAEPVPGALPVAPAVPQAPCFLCATVRLVNEMSHVPLCGGCIKTIRSAV